MIRLRRSAVFEDVEGHFCTFEIIERLLVVLNLFPAMVAFWGYNKALISGTIVDRSAQSCLVARLSES